MAAIHCYHRHHPVSSSRCQPVNTKGSSQLEKDPRSMHGVPTIKLGHQQCCLRVRILSSVSSVCLGTANARCRLSAGRRHPCVIPKCPVSVSSSTSPCSWPGGRFCSKIRLIHRGSGVTAGQQKQQFEPCRASRTLQLVFQWTAADAALV